jgi:FKBP-type peptidyl-prolyl cis-trans isomerase
MPNPIVPGGVTDSTTTKTAEEIAAEEAAKAAKEAEDKVKAEEEARKAAEEEARRKAEEEAAANENENDEDANKIILTTDEGDVEYELDAEGNAVKDGQIVYTKAQLDEFAAAEQQEETIDVSAISAISGLTPVNADGTPKQYDMTVEGLAQRDADIAEIARHQAESEAITNFFRANPDIHQAALYKQTYGSLEGFANHVDWTTMSIEDKSEAQLEAIIRSAEKRKGTSDAQIDRIIRFSKADKVLNETAKESLDYLAANQKREIEEATARQEAQWKAEQDELDKAYGITYDDRGKAKVLNVPDSLYDKIVNKGTIGGLAIPTAGVKRTVNGKEQILTRKDIVKYLTAPVVEIGDSLYTQAQKDVFDMLADNETFAMVALRNLLGADISQLAAASIRQENVRRLNITSGGKPKVKVSTQGGVTKVNPNRRPVVPGGIVDSNK